MKYILKMTMDAKKSASKNFFNVNIFALGSLLWIQPLHADGFGIDFTPGTYQSTSSKDSYDVKKFIGAGNFGNVYAGQSKNGSSKGSPVAVKFYKNNKAFNLDALLSGFTKAKELCPKLCSKGLHEIIDVGPFISSFKLGPVKGVVSELGVADGRVLSPYLWLDDKSTKNLTEFANRIEFASALFQFMSEFQKQLAIERMSLNDIKPENFIISKDHRVLFADFDTFHSTGKTPKIFTILNAAPEQFDEVTTSTTDLFLIANTILQYLSGQLLIDHLRATFPALILTSGNPKTIGDNYRFSYAHAKAKDATLEVTLNRFFNKILTSFEVNITSSQKSLDPQSPERILAGETLRQTKFLFEGLRSALLMDSESRKHYLDPRFAMSDENSSGKSTPDKVISGFLSQIMEMEAQCKKRK